MQKTGYTAGGALVLAALLSGSIIIWVLAAVVLALPVRTTYRQLTGTNHKTLGR